MIRSDYILRLIEQLGAVMRAYMSGGTVDIHEISHAEYDRNLVSARTRAELLNNRRDDSR